MRNSRCGGPEPPGPAARAPQLRGQVERRRRPLPWRAVLAAVLLVAPATADLDHRPVRKQHGVGVRARVVQRAAPDAREVVPAGLGVALVEERDAVGGQGVARRDEGVGLGLVGAAELLDLDATRPGPPAAARRSPRRGSAWRSVCPSSAASGGCRAARTTRCPWSTARRRGRGRSASRTGAGSSRRPAAGPGRPGRPSRRAGSAGRARCASATGVNSSMSSSLSP